MEVFLMLLAKLIPLYVVILLGYIAGRFLNVKKETIAPLLIYTIVPVVVFSGVVGTKISLDVVSIPLLFFSIGTCIALITFFVSQFVWKDTTRNILAFTAGSGNTGYFGLPVSVALFGPNIIGIVSLVILGINLYETSVGFFLTARGHHSAKEALIKVFKLPILYAYLLGLVVSISGIHLSNIFFDAAANFRGAFTVLGMMIIGMALSDVKSYKFDIKFITTTFFIKFLIWPLIMLLTLFVNNNWLHIFDNSLSHIMILMAIVPLAGNTVSYATLLKAQPEKASLAVLLSTIFALFYIPLITVYFLK